VAVLLSYSPQIILVEAKVLFMRSLVNSQAKILTAVKWAEQMVESMRMLGPAIAINRSEVASTNGVQGGEDCPSHNGPRAPLQMYLRYCTLALSMLSVSVFA